MIFVAATSIAIYGCPLTILGNFSYSHHFVQDLHLIILVEQATVT